MSPELGRFLQPDPIGFKGDASNLYRYCGNDWANKTDPLGLTDIDGYSELVPFIVKASVNSAQAYKAASDAGERPRVGRSQYVLQKLDGAGKPGKPFLDKNADGSNRINKAAVQTEWRHGILERSGQDVRLREIEQRPSMPKGTVGGAIGHFHDNKTGIGQRDFSDVDRNSASTTKSGQGTPIGLINESEVSRNGRAPVHILVPQKEGGYRRDDKSAPSVQVYDKSAPQASNAEPADIGGEGFVALGGVFFGERNEGVRTGGQP
jgi:uncharacterized protein RhaS with RHS repeats